MCYHSGEALDSITALIDTLSSDGHVPYVYLAGNFICIQG